MPLGKVKSENSEQVQNERRPSGSNSVPIACRVCERVFFDNVSLVLHFEVHVNEGYRLRGRDLSSLRSGHQLSSNQSPYSRSSLARKNGANHAVPSKMNDHIRPSSLPANHMPKELNIPYVPARSVVSSLSPSFDARLNVSQPAHQPIMRRHGATSSSTSQLMYSQLGKRKFAFRAPHLQLRKQNGGLACSPNYKNAPFAQLEKPNQVITLSDDEDKSTSKIDLTLKL